MADLQPLFHIDGLRTPAGIVWQVRCALCAWMDANAGDNLERAKGYAVAHVQAAHAPPGAKVGPLTRVEKA